MKKFVIFALAVLIAFAMCSCQPTADNFEGTVPFRLDVGGARAKAIEATDARLTAVKEIQLKFTAKNQSNPVGASSDWESDLIDYDETTGKGTWAGGDRYMSQGQWLIEAQALDENSKVIFEGSVTVYVSKVVNSATITLVPKENETLTGKVEIKPLKSNGVFAEEEKSYHRLALNIYTIEGEEAIDTVYLNADSFAVENGENTVTYKGLEGTDAITLPQGSYIATAQLEQYDAENDKWVEATGGSATDFMVINENTTVIKGSVRTDEYITLSTDTLVDINSEIGLSMKWTANSTDPSGDGTFEATATLPIGSTTELTDILWWVSGRAPYKTTYNTTGANTYSPTLPKGEFEVAVYVLGKTEAGQTIKSAMCKLHLTDVNGTGGWTWSAN